MLCIFRRTENFRQNSRKTKKTIHLTSNYVSKWGMHRWSSSAVTIGCCRWHGTIKPISRIYFKYQQMPLAALLYLDKPWKWRIKNKIQKFTCKNCSFSDKFGLLFLVSIFSIWFLFSLPLKWNLKVLYENS